MTKKLVSVFIFVFVTALVFAQESYTIKMSIKMEGMPAEYAAYGEQELVTFLKGEKSKTEISSMMISSTKYFDGKNYVVLAESMGNKTGFTATKEELEADEKKGKENLQTKVEYTADRKKIAGYECTKAIVTTTDETKKESKVIVWVTDKIKMGSTKKSSVSMIADLGDLKVQPLAMEASQQSNGMDLKLMLTTTEVLTTPINDNFFVPNTEGYIMNTYKDWINKMKAMQGGK